MIRKKITQHAFTIPFQEYLNFEDFEIKDSDIQINETPYYFNKYIFKAGFPEVILEEYMDIDHLMLNEYFNSILLWDIVMSRVIRKSVKIIEPR